MIRLLLSASNKGEIRRFVDQYFEKFKPLNVSIVSEYMETLEILTKNGWNQKASAKELHIHYNTLRYRLQKISQICNYDIENPETRVELSVALKLYNINKNMKES